MSLTRRLPIWLLTTVFVAHAWAAHPGDEAPSLSIDEWVRGGPVDLKSLRGKQIAMVEFWATWCPPCKASVPRLTDIQRRFKKDLTIIGVTALDDRGNTRKAVQRFVKEQGDNMDYVVAIDQRESTMGAYLGDLSMVGIPYAFLVNKDGKIAWEGSPLDPSLEEVITQLVAGTYDLDAVRVQAEVVRRFEELSFSLQMGQWSRVWDGLIGILKLDPTNETAMDLLMRIYVEQTRDETRFRSFVATHIATHRGNGLAMARLASTLCNIEDLTARTPDLALEAARAAYDASDRKDLQAATVYARVMYQIGALDRAIELQREAIAMAGDPDRAHLEDVLEFYHHCKKLQQATP